MHVQRVQVGEFVVMWFCTEWALPHLEPSLSRFEGDVVTFEKFLDGYLGYVVLRLIRRIVGALPKRATAEPHRPEDHAHDQY